MKNSSKLKIMDNELVFQSEILVGLEIIDRKMLQVQRHQRNRLKI